MNMKTISTCHSLGRDCANTSLKHLITLIKNLHLLLCKPNRVRGQTVSALLSELLIPGGAVWTSPLSFSSPCPPSSTSQNLHLSSWGRKTYAGLGFLHLERVRLAPRTELLSHILSQSHKNQQEPVVEWQQDWLQVHILQPRRPGFNSCIHTIFQLCFHCCLSIEKRVGFHCPSYNHHKHADQPSI